MLTGRSWLLLVVLLGLLAPLPAYQQAPFVRCGDSAAFRPLECGLEHLLDVPVRIYNFLLGMAGVVALAMIVWAGVRMMIFHVSEQPESELANAKLTLTRGIFGLLIVAGAYLIVNVVLYLLGFNSEGTVGQLLGDRFGL